MEKSITPNHLLSLKDIVGMILSEGAYVHGYITSDEVRLISQREGYKSACFCQPTSIMTADYDPSRLRVYIGKGNVITSVNAG